MSGKHRRAPGAGPVRLRESGAGTAVLDPPAPATLPTPAPAVAIAEATLGGVTPAGGRRFRARLIEGNRWGSSGYYPRAVLERDGPTVAPAGTQMYLNHPTPTEAAERPERDVRDLAAQLVTTAVYEGDGLYAEVEVFPHALPLIESVGKVIGLSIRGRGTADTGTIGGRTGPIIESLTGLDSVDFVTRAGAGGKLVSLAEAARAGAMREAVKRTLGQYIEARLHLAFTEMADDMYGGGKLDRPERITLSQAIGDGLKAFTATVEKDAPQLFQRDIWDGPASVDTATTEAARRLAETSTSDQSRAIQSAVYDAYGQLAVGGCLWVRDFDPDRHLVWFDLRDETDTDTYQQSYTATGADGDMEVTLVGEPIQVVARTVYDPVPADDVDPDDLDAAAASDGAPMQEAGKAKAKPYGDVKYADTGFRADKQQRYPIDTADHVRAAWSYINQDDNASQYSAANLKTVRSRIMAAAKRFGIEIATDTAESTTADPSGGSQPITEAAPSQTDGTPPTETIPTTEEAGMSGTQNEPGAAGTSTDTVVPAAVTEAQTAQAAAEAKLAEAETRRVAAETELAQLRAVEAARPIAATLLAESQLPAPSQARVLAAATATVPLTEANVLDEVKFKEAVTAAAKAEETYVAQLAEAGGAGRVTGLGGTTTPTVPLNAERLSARADKFQLIGMSEAAAKVAASGGRR